MKGRPMKAWVSSSGSRTTCDPHALSGDQCGEQRGPDLQGSETIERKSVACMPGSVCGVLHVSRVCVGVARL